MPTRGIELWGGIECTLARIGDAFRDQVRETGHDRRPDDLDRIAALGIRTLRYPILWETLAADGASAPDWAWHDRQLGRLRELGIRPIAGLVHHGSGPRSTDLLDPDFAAGLARHAARVARRYPWITDWTPVNEPLTTARFATLYGHWHPHRRDEGALCRALVNQCRGVMLAMRAVRRIVPEARLVATEDLGRTFSTPALVYQAEHENGRRWLTFDLLTGRLDRRHPWWPVLRGHGVPACHLDAFLDGEARPDILGLNHYLTSERFLDGRLARYPRHLWGGNGREAYADVEAVRVEAVEGLTGPVPRLREAWARYGVPLAVTEVHHGCTRDEQLRWLAEMWDAAATLKREGADIRAVTIWSLLGAVDWNSLLTRREGIYEPGAFDVRAKEARPTALAAAAASLATTGAFDHPALDRPGWWRRDGRFYRPARRPRLAEARAPRSLLLVGHDGPLLDAFARIAAARGLDRAIVAPDNEAELRRALATGRVWGLLDLVDPPEGRRADDSRALARLARAFRRTGAQILSVSSEAPGHIGERPEVESDGFRAEGPRSAGAHAARLREAVEDALIVRTGPLFGPWGSDSPAFRMLWAMARDKAPELGPGRTAPSYLPDLAHVALDLLCDRVGGLWHLVGGEPVSADEVAADLAHRAGLPAPTWQTPGLGGALASERGALMPPLASALERFLRDLEIDWRPAASARAAA